MNHSNECKITTWPGTAGEGSVELGKLLQVSGRLSRDSEGYSCLQVRKGESCCR